ncbi:hypothetical protein A2U01_0005766 [Trifolium medium]|uniref:Uncharacterized protein n=1 Tax=Trifolium medium TaxID=97028 RepID=A0A392MDS8_9FABA|nr:hypothetical protein [Trifolium medium]
MFVPPSHSTHFAQSEYDTLASCYYVRISSDQIVKNNDLSSLGFLISDWEAMVLFDGHDSTQKAEKLSTTLEQIKVVLEDAEKKQDTNDSIKILIFFVVIETVGQRMKSRIRLAT